MKNSAPLAAAALLLLAAAPQDGNVTLAGKVVDDSTGQPIPRIVFNVYLQAGESGGGQQKTVTTDEAGTFTLSVRKGSRAFVLWNPGRSHLLDMEWLEENGGRYVQLGAVEADRTGLDLKVRLRPAVELKVRVMDVAGQPARRANAYFDAETPPAVAGDSGEAVFKLAPADKDYDLYVVSSDGKQAALVRLKAGAKEAAVALRPALDLKGEAVADDGKPAANLQFTTHMVLNGRPFMEMARRSQGLVSGADGRFAFKGACEGAAYQLSWYPGQGGNASYHQGGCSIVAAKDAPVRVEVKRFIDDWDAPGNIGVGAETRCKDLNDYCLDLEDNILACEGSKQAVLQITPGDKLKATWPLGFVPEAIECRADGVVIVAGGGKIALLDGAGKKLKEAALPGKATTATGVSGSGEDVFVCVQGGTGYAIYRLNAELGDPKAIVKDLRGCCGQMDFTARDGALYVAANCAFKVQKYDREGKKLAEFGKNASGGDPEGFEGCCEPKNVCFDSRGDLYTAESGSCAVKKFSADGKFLAHVGKVPTIRGCVRVSVWVSKDLSRVYMLDTSRNIVRLVRPEKKAP